MGAVQRLPVAPRTRQTVEFDDARASPDLLGYRPAAPAAPAAAVGMKEPRGPKNSLLALARSRVGVPVYVLFIIPFLFALSQFAFLGSDLPASVVPPSRQTDAELRASLQTAANASVPACAHAGQAKSFVIMFMGHSGSTAMITALEQHPSVSVSEYEPLDHGVRANNAHLALTYADNYFKKTRAKGLVGGFKVRPRNILKEVARWRRLFEKHDTRIIWNFRGNTFKQAVGHYPIRFLNDSSRYEGLKHGEASDRVQRFRIHDMGALHTLLLDRVRGETHVELAMMNAARGRCVLPVGYEAFLKDAGLQTLRMQAFLGLDLAKRLKPGRRKATGDNMCDVISNWDEVCEAFFGCASWRGMMEDVDNNCTCSNLDIGMRPLWHRYCFKNVAKSAYFQSGMMIDTGADV